MIRETGPVQTDPWILEPIRGLVVRTRIEKLKNRDSRSGHGFSFEIRGLTGPVREIFKKY